MAADFPNSKKTFTDLVDGTDYMEAVNVNTAYDEIEALETMLGAMGVTQSNTRAYNELLSNYRRGCDPVYDSTTQFTVNAGEISFNSGSVYKFRKNTSGTTVTSSDIDTGSIANSTKYYIYADGDAAGTGFAVVFSTSGSAPTGVTYYRLIDGS